MKKVNLIISLLIFFVVLLVLDHYRIHGYFFDMHDLLLQTESGLGYDSHEFWEMFFGGSAGILGLISVYNRHS